MTPHGTFCWNELRTWDAEKAKSFYAQTLGWTYEAMDGAGGEYWIAMSGGQPVGGIFQMSNGQGMDDAPDHWSVFIAVDETGSFIARALAFAVHGDGETLLDAEADLRACPAEYYDLVEEGARLPDPYDQREIERLHAWIVARP